MRKAATISGIVFAGILVLAVFLYSRFVGFEKPSLASRFPESTLALLEVRHIRKTAFAFSQDEQLQASIDVVSAILKTITDAADDTSFPDTDVEIEAALLRRLGSHFKTRVALAAFAPENTPAAPSFVLSSYFYGDVSEFDSTLREIAKQASTTEESYAIQSSQRDGTTFSKLEISFQDPNKSNLSLEPCWAVYDDVFYLASNIDTLARVIEFNRSSEKIHSIQSKLSTHSVNEYLPDPPELTLAINGKPLERYLANLARARIKQEGGLWLGVSPEVLVSELGFSKLDSALIAIELDGEQKTYSSVRYTPSPTNLRSENPERFLIQAPDDLFLYGSESLNLRPSAFVDNIKNAFLRAAPLANFPYIAFKSRVLARTGLDFEQVLNRSFGQNLIYLHSLDTGTVPNRFGQMHEAVIHDHAFKFQLTETEQLKTLWSYWLEQIATATSLPISIEDNTTYFDLSGDTSATGDRLAVDLNEQYLTIGIGTLKCFSILRERDEYIVSNEQPQSEPILKASQIGEGKLSLQGLPQQLFHLASVFYLQMNPGKSVPVEFYDFDWSALAALEQVRQSKTFVTEDGHLFRISKIAEQ